MGIIMGTIAIVFPGQGAQYPGMGKSWCNGYEVARRTFEEANDVLHYDIKGLCSSGSLSKISALPNMMACLLATNVAIYRVFAQTVDMPIQYGAGHSMGELAALVCSGVLKFSDALEMAKYRSYLAEKVAKSQIGAMTIINGLDEQEVQFICEDLYESGNILSIACYNGNKQFVVSGTNKSVLKLEKRAIEKNGQVTPMLVSAPFHCLLMKKAANDFQSEIFKYTFQKGKWPVISNISALPYEKTGQAVDVLTKQLYCPVRWSDTLDYMVSHGVDTIIEIGPQNILSNMINDNGLPVKALAFGTKEGRNYINDLKEAL
jgi:[acyl-carrier-protein] S-malonyltransferase